MNKTVLLLDKMPDSCRDCRFFIQELNYVCVGKQHCNGEQLEWLKYNYARRKPNWCPLRELPKEIQLKGIIKDYGCNTDYEDGWNNCLETIICN